MAHRRSTKARAPSPGAIPDNPHLEKLREHVASASTEPGIYRWMDEKGTILYVGKAKNLRKRLSQYVHPNKSNDGPWRRAFLAQIAGFDVTVTNSELEALMLETNLIKELKPKYNVLMKDGKNYLYIRISHDPYPRVETSRRFQQDGARYFGPFMNSDTVRQTLDMLHMAVQYRACKQSIDLLNRNDGVNRSTLRACLEFQIGRCNGLCTGTPDQAEYNRRIELVVKFLKGQKETVRAILQEKMQKAAFDKKFEQAAHLRNLLQSVDQVQEKQLATDTAGDDVDAIGIAILSERAHVVVLQRRNGRIINEFHHKLAGHAEDEKEVLEQFLPQFYDDGLDVPSSIIIPATLTDKRTMEEWLTLKRSGLSNDETKQKQSPSPLGEGLGVRANRGRVTLIVPERGKKSHLLQLAEKNAIEKARLEEIKWETDKANTEAALEGLKRLLALPGLPHRIEGYDISHLGGTETVGSMVVMKNGKSANDQYRSFTIRTMKAGVIDDYRSLKEVLSRRLRHFCEDIPAEEKEWEKQGMTFGKARKSEQEAIEHIHAEHASEVSSVGISYRQYLVARHEEKIIGFGRLFQHPNKTLELKSIWVDAAWRGKKLGQFIGRKILRGIKKGKVYVTIVPDLEEYYGALGFRYVIKPPPILVQEMEEEKRKFPETPMGIVMVREASQNKPDSSLSAKPDLIVIDGGKGQLSAVMEVITECKLDIPVIGLAKREEEIFVPDRSDPIDFPKESQAKFLLMRLRDEAHRFANRLRETKGKHKAVASALDEIPGIGEKTKGELLKKFGSVAGVKNATDETLKEVMTEEQLLTIRKVL